MILCVSQKWVNEKSIKPKDAGGFGEIARGFWVTLIIIYILNYCKYAKTFVKPFVKDAKTLFGFGF